MSQFRVKRLHQRVAADLNLDQVRLNECFADPKTNDNIRLDYDAGRSLGIIGTPTFLLGRSLPDGARGRILEGAPSFDALERQIEELLPQDQRKIGPSKQKVSRRRWAGI